MAEYLYTVLLPAVPAVTPPILDQRLSRSVDGAAFIDETLSTSTTQVTHGPVGEGTTLVLRLAYRNQYGYGPTKEQTFHGPGSLLLTVGLTAGNAVFGAPLAPGDLRPQLALKVFDPSGTALVTQTDVKTVWPDGSAKFAIVTCQPTSTGNYSVRTSLPPSGSFTPVVPSAVATFTVYNRFTLLGDFAVASGTLKVKVRNIAGAGKLVADAIYIEAVDAGGAPTGVSYVVDDADGSPAYTETGIWGNGGTGYLSGLNCGYAHAVRISADATATATWQKTGLPSGTYRVSASWINVPGDSTFGYATTLKAGYEVFDNASSLGELTLSQIWPGGEVGGFTLGDFVISGGTCNVRLGNATAVAGLYAAADKVAIYKSGVLIAQKSVGDAGITLSGFALTSGYASTNDQSGSTAVYLSVTALGGTNTANYAFTSLASGTYRVVVWQPWGQAGGPSNQLAAQNGVIGTPFADDVPWTVLDGATSRGTVTVNQKIWSGRSKTVAYTATLASVVGTDVWLNGPLVKEWRRWQSPVDGGSTAHPALRLAWDVRCFLGGDSRVQVAVENCFNKARVVPVFYDVSVTVGGVEIFSQLMQEHWCSTRWTKIGFVSMTESTVTPDFSRAYSSSAKLLPKYEDDVAVWVPDSNIGYPSSGFARWQILRPGGINQYNMYTGSVDYVGPYPQWVAGYLVNLDTNELSYMMETARNSIAAYPVHYRGTDDTVLNQETNPNFWADQRNSSAYTLFDAGAVGNELFRFLLAGDMSHHPQAALIPYLLTGERYLADELAFWVGFEIQAAGSVRSGASMILQALEARAAGWSLRTVAENVALLPDAHEVKSWGETSVANTLQWHDDYAAGLVKWLTENEFFVSASPVAYMPITSGNSTDVTGGLFPRISANWQNVYVLYGIQRARDLGLTGASVAANAVARITALSLGEFGGQQTVGFESDLSVSTYPRQANDMLLINEGFNGVCSDDANYAKDWNVQVGTAGTHVIRGSRAESYGMLNCLKLVSDGSTLAAVYQQFNTPNSNLANAGGTADVLLDSVSYYLLTWMKISATDSTGTVILELVDGSGVVHNGNQFTVNVNGLTTSYVRKVFTITTATLPGTYRLRIRFGSSPTSGRSVFLSPVVLYRVPSAGHQIQATEFYTCVGYNESSTTTYYTDWDGLLAGATSSGRASAAYWPDINNFPEHTLSLNIAERLGLSGAVAAYDACITDPNYFNRDNFKFIRGMYE